ncbi:MAG: hypothetical protein ABI114_10145 [Rhodanobacter sp.]
MNEHYPPIDNAQVEGWIDDLAAHEQATERIMAMGTAAREPLLHYLQRGPQLVSQPRVFAVKMLARLHDVRVPETLRTLLYEHPLHHLSAPLAEAEYRVKDAVVEAMVLTQACATPADIAFAVQSERLPAAVYAAGTMHLASLGSTLAELLTDDVLAAPAATALSNLQPASVTAVMQALHAWLSPKAETTRTRLGLIRGFSWLATTSTMCERALQEQGLQHASTLVRAAAALSMYNDVTMPVVSALAHGVLGSDALLALACRSRLQKMGEPLFEPIIDALRANIEEDVYGNRHPAEAGARRWLLIHLLRQTVMDTERFQQISADVPADELAAALYRLNAPRIEVLQHAMRHGDARVRTASIIALGRIDADATASCLAFLLGDVNHTVRRKAYRTLRRYLMTRPGEISSFRLSLAAWWRSPRRCLQLLVLSSRPKK